MIPLVKDEMFTNKFVSTKLPTKKQIFARTGERAVNPAGSYSGDDPVKRPLTKTESAEAFARSAEAYEKPSEDLPE